MKTILCVDDDPWVLEVLTTALEPKGHKLLTAANATDALRFLRDQRIDLVLLDFNLGGPINGFALYDMFVKHGYPPVLFVSACPKSFTPESEQFARIWREKFIFGRTDILYKPFRIDQLYEKIESLIGAQEAADHGPGN